MMEIDLLQPSEQPGMQHHAADEPVDRLLVRIHAGFFQSIRGGDQPSLLGQRQGVQQGLALVGDEMFFQPFQIAQTAVRFFLHQRGDGGQFE